MSAASDLAKILQQLDQAHAVVARLGRELMTVGERFSRERGYFVPLTKDQLRLELDRIANPPRRSPLGARIASAAPRQLVRTDPAVEAGRVERRGR